MILFQSTHPRRMRLPHHSSVYRILTFQSTHPRRMRLGHDALPMAIQRISIHASKKDATKPQNNIGIGDNISIHASKKDATRSDEFLYVGGFISIHASKKDATCILSPIDYIVCYFNPRIQEGCDRWTQHYLVLIFVFQSTHPRRMRPGFAIMEALSIVISIHASKKDATQLMDNNKLYREISIHASKKDATLDQSTLAFSFIVFQSTHPRRMRRSISLNKMS